MISVTCTHCGCEILVPPTVQGKQGLCFNCQQPLEVPTVTSIERHRKLAFETGNKIAGRYTIEKLVGQGGMGVVYRAQDTLVNELVALKFMRPAMLRTQRGQQMFIQEAQIARRLRHDNIIAVHDVSWTIDGVLYLSMEYVAGQSLREFLRQKRVERRYLEVRLAVSYATQILSALEYAHKMVIHRDMKPENVMLLSGERLKVLDFGLAKAIQEEYPDEKKEAPGKRVVGTLAYTSPEQRRREPVDLRSDIYAVGLLMHELLTLRTPMDEPVSINEARDDVAPALVDVIQKSLEERKEHRFQSAKEFRHAIKQAYDKAYRKTTVTLPQNGDQTQQASTENMVHFEGGSFVMGSDDFKESAPEEEVYVPPFWMDIHPVTVHEYEEFMKATGHAEPKYWNDDQFNGPNQPIVGVSWDDAMAYAHWAGKQLPTEAQWEFAARGRENRTYPWGNLPPDNTLCNFRDFLGMPSMIGMHDGCTPDGIYDLAGNVLEWVRDPYAPYRTIRQNPEKAESSPRRTVRGGCYLSPPDELRNVVRRGLFPESYLRTVGFRCVLEDPK